MVDELSVFHNVFLNREIVHPWPFRLLNNREMRRRATEAIDLIVRKRGQDGRWDLENPHPEQLDLGMDESEGKPSRWNTLRALRVLDWYSARD